MSQHLQSYIKTPRKLINPLTVQSLLLFVPNSEKNLLLGEIGNTEEGIRGKDISLNTKCENVSLVTSEQKEKY